MTREGPVFFRQVRLGLNMCPFTALKFRTMRLDADEGVHRDYIRQTMTSSASVGANGIYKLDRDDVTRIGRWLRRTSLDELPQLVNVLRGDMSLVGPRPCIPYETELFQDYHFERFLVPAGLTGLWQVAARANATFGEALDMDVAYARGWTLGLDLRLLCRTPLEILRQRGTSLMSIELFRESVRQREPSPYPPVRVAVVGLGYWGPNLVRNLEEHPNADLVAVCDRREDALVKTARRYPALKMTKDLDDILLSDEHRGGRDRDAGLDALPDRLRGAGRRQARVRREADGCVIAGGARPRAARRARRPRADAGTHVPLQPAGEPHPRPAASRRARRDLLHLDEPGEPRPASARRERRLGPRPA